MSDRDLKVLARVRSERESRGWSRRELAQRSGITVSLIGAYERGDVSPTLRTLGKILDALGMASVEDQFPGGSDMSLWTTMKILGSDSSSEELTEAELLEASVAALGLIGATTARLDSRMRARLEQVRKVRVKKKK